MRRRHRRGPAAAADRGSPRGGGARSDDPRFRAQPTGPGLPGRHRGAASGLAGRHRSRPAAAAAGSGRAPRRDPVRGTRRGAGAAARSRGPRRFQPDRQGSHRRAPSGRRHGRTGGPRCRGVPERLLRGGRRCDRAVAGSRGAAGALRGAGGGGGRARPRGRTGVTGGAPTGDGVRRRPASRRRAVRRRCLAHGAGGPARGGTTASVALRPRPCRDAARGQVRAARGSDRGPQSPCAGRETVRGRRGERVGACRPPASAAAGERPARHGRRASPRVPERLGAAADVAGVGGRDARRRRHGEPRDRGAPVGAIRTVEVHLGRVFAKLHVRNRVELTVLAHRTEQYF
ncbi:LuxR C-terminal-related transcriptional regulator [Microbacterium sp. NPDC077486]|uniref:LuxR C-terminal-related transcriptional regulator n=1 Tax=Microbacterium sp. NPDC077486 TaxID=3154766 RepID=UPI003441CA4E